MRRYTRIGRLRIFGAPLYVHWSVIIGAAVVLGASRGSLLTAAVALASYFAVLLIHEAGHAWFARRQRLQPSAIRLYVIHGTCEYHTPETEEQDCIVAWGGVLAQLAVAIPLIAFDKVFHFGRIEPWGAVVGVLGYVSLWIASLNLFPAQGLDGGRAWRIFPLWLENWRARRARRSRRKRNGFSAVK